VVAIDRLRDRGHHLSYKGLAHKLVLPAVEQITRIVQTVLLYIHACVVRVEGSRVGLRSGRL
jgi:hypothetical protein